MKTRFLILLALLITCATQAQRTPIYQRYSWIGGEFKDGFLLPRDTTTKPQSDTGSLAFKNGQLYVYKLKAGTYKWDSASGVADLSSIPQLGWENKSGFDSLMRKVSSGVYDVKAIQVLGTSSNITVAPTKTDSTLSYAIDLPNTAVTPGTYGDASHTVTLTADTKGRITNIFQNAIAGGGGMTASQIERLIMDSVFNGYGGSIGVRIGVTYPTIPSTLGQPIVWHWISGGAGGHDTNFMKDSMVANGKSLDIWYNNTKYVMFGVAIMDDKFSGLGQTLGTGVDLNVIHVASTLVAANVTGYAYFSTNNFFMGNGYRGSMSWAYDTTTAILTVSNNPYQITQEQWNLDIKYIGDNAYKWKQLRNSLPGAELSTLKFQLVSNLTDEPILGALSINDAFIFQGNNVPYQVDLNTWDATSSQLIFANSNMWVMYIYAK